MKRSSPQSPAKVYTNSHSKSNSAQTGGQVSSTQCPFSVPLTLPQLHLPLFTSPEPCHAVKRPPFTGCLDGTVFLHNTAPQEPNTLHTGKHARCTMCSLPHCTLRMARTAHCTTHRVNLHNAPCQSAQCTMSICTMIAVYTADCTVACAKLPSPVAHGALKGVGGAPRVCQCSCSPLFITRKSSRQCMALEGGKK